MNVRKNVSKHTHTKLIKTAKLIYIIFILTLILGCLISLNVQERKRCCD